MKTIRIQKECGYKSGIKKYLLSAFFLMVSFFIINGAREALAQETITVPLEPFTRISFSNTSKVKLTPGSANSITFTGSEEDAERLKESVEGGELELKGRPLSNMNVTFKHIESIEIKGTSTVTCADTIQADEFDIDISGMGDLTLNVNANRVSVDISGAGNLNLAGSAEELNLDISGAGNVTADNFRTKVCNADISGSGHCTVDVTEELNSSISGSGSVSYKNPPTRINKDISGMGHVGDDHDSFTEGDTTRFRLGDKKILIISGNDSLKKSKPEKVQPHWAGIEIGFNGYLTKDNKMNPEGYDFLELNQFKSVAVSLNFFDYGIKLYKRYVMLVTGAGLTYNNYRFRNNYVLDNGDSGIYGIKVDVDSLSFSKSKLTVSYVTVPLLLEFNTSKYSKRSFHISAGAVFGYRIGSHTKQVYTEDNKKQKLKTYDEFSINPWRVDATARIGYRNFNLFANYDLVTLFRSGKGPELYPFTVGLTLAGW